MTLRYDYRKIPYQKLKQNEQRYAQELIKNYKSLQKKSFSSLSDSIDTQTCKRKTF